jgi:hypothetical protein
MPVSGLSGAVLVAANADIDQYLRGQPGFRWRRIAQHDDGTVVDIVPRDTAAQTRASAGGIMTEIGPTRRRMWGQPVGLMEAR